MERKVGPSDNWKWNYFQENLPTTSMKPAVENVSEHNKRIPKHNAKSRKSHEKLTNTRREDSVSVITEHPALRENSFYQDFDAFSISMNKLVENNASESPGYNIQETDLLSNVRTDNLPRVTGPRRACDIKETMLLDDNLDEDIKETCLIGTSDHLLDEYNKVYLNLDGRDETEHNGKKEEKSIDQQDIDRCLDTENAERNEELIIDFLKVKSDSKDDLLRFEDAENDNFERDSDITDSGMFSLRETEYFQDIASDFFEEDEEKEDSFAISLPTTLHKCDKTKSHSYRSPPLTPSKTATLSNGLLRSTISELERALNDSNKLLAERDEKIQVLRTRNAELKKKLVKEVEDNLEMKQIVDEKGKMILGKQAEIEDLNQQIHQLNRRLSHFANGQPELTKQRPQMNGDGDKVIGNYCSNGEICSKVPIVEKGDAANLKSSIDSSIRSSFAKLFSSSKSNEQDVETTSKMKTVEQLQTLNKGKENSKSKINFNTENDTSNSNDLQDNLRIKFLRDAFFYYMIGFYPDEQINAILAILEYGDRRQEFVMEAHTMRKLGKKFNVSQVFKHGFPFIQE